MQPSRAIITHLNGVFWLRNNGESQRIPSEQTTSQETLSLWVEQLIGEREVFYNYPDNLLPDSEPSQTVIIQPSRKLAPPKPIWRAPVLTMAQEMALKTSGPHNKGTAKQETRTCDNPNCRKVFQRRPKKTDAEQEKFYCSLSCSGQCQKGELKSKTITLECGHCKQSFERNRRNFDRGAKVHFCNRTCKHQHFRENPNNQNRQVLLEVVPTDKVA